MEGKTKKEILYCPHCGNTSIQTLLLDQEYEEKFYGVSDGSQKLLPAKYNVIKCETCSEILVYAFNYEIDAEGSETPFGRLMYPKQTAFNHVVPEKIREVYFEAVKVKNLSPIAFVVLARRLLEEIIKERGVKKHNLAGALDELATRGEIPAVLADASTIIRLIGNTGAHASDQKITMPQTWAIDDFLKAIIEYLYVAPAKVKEFKKKFLEVKVDGFAKANKPITF